jgi:hypothetical protein
LSIVRYRAKAVHGNGHRAHAQEAEGHQTKGKHRSGKGKLRMHCSDN